MFAYEKMLKEKVIGELKKKENCLPPPPLPHFKSHEMNV